MGYIGTPVTFLATDTSVRIARDLEERISMLDRLVELIVYTPRGSFSADPDFGFEYWNHEFSNVNDALFNNNSTGKDEYNKEGAKARCQESVRQSLMSYAPDLKDVEVSMVLDAPDTDSRGRQKVFSRHIVTVEVTGKLDNGLGTYVDYYRPVEFFMEPTSKRRQAY